MDNYGGVPDPIQLFPQHEGAEAPGHALGQVVDIELHRVQGGRRLHGGTGSRGGDMGPERD